MTYQELVTAAELDECRRIMQSAQPWHVTDSTTTIERVRQ